MPDSYALTSRSPSSHRFKKRTKKDMHASSLQPNPDEGLSKLPPHATLASRVRYEAAQALVDLETIKAHNFPIISLLRQTELTSITSAPPCHLDTDTPLRRIS